DPAAGENDHSIRDSGEAKQQICPRIYLPWVVLALGIPLSIFLATVVRDSLENVARLRFERQTSEAESMIEDRVHSYAGILYGLKAHFASLNQVSRLQFHRVVESLDLPHCYPGLDLVNYAV